MTLTLPDWLFEGILMKGGVLTIHEDYFLLTGGIERWLYRVARKHAGQQETGWQFTMRQLYEKSGSTSRFSDFAIDVRKVVELDSLPEYTAEIHKNEEGEEVIPFLKRDLLDSQRSAIRDAPPSAPPSRPRHHIEIVEIQRCSRMTARPIRRKRTVSQAESTAYQA